MRLEFLGNLAHRLTLARSLPPRLVLAKIARRLPWSDLRRVRIAEIVHAPKDRRPDRLIGFFRDQEALCVDRTGQPPIDFAGKRVLEIGPGPLAGWGPMALFRGADSVHAVDPDWVEGVLDAAEVETAYLRPHHAALVAAFGPLMDYAAFRSRLQSGLFVTRAGLASLRLDRPADLVLSNSCLEHIDDLEPALANLARLSAPGARFMHLVNFGNHRDRASPFRTIYEMPPDRYRRRYGAHINLKRVPDVGAAFARAGVAARTLVVDRRPDALAGLAIDPWWLDRYGRDDLAVRTALFTGPLDRQAAAGGDSGP